MSDDVKLIAYFLTQFHPVPENDAWWGRGFTEWTNATKARPLFKGHYQPHLPTDLGFYDLRVRETRHAQIEMAKEYGLHGFCYYYYWFSGKRLLERPLDDMFADPDSDFPYCLCWANENWTKRWDAGSTQLLMEQRYLEEDDLGFITSVQKYLEDPRYIRANGRPLLLVYRPQQMPDPKRSAAVWRDHCRKVGIGEIEIRAVSTHGNWSYEQFGFDGSVQFPPHNLKSLNQSKGLKFYEDFFGYCPDYRDVAEEYLSHQYGPQNRGYRAVFPSWDNTARLGPRATAILNGTPENYEFWLKQAVEKARQENAGEDSFVFINAWNEWAEGAHLEPDRKYGRRFLEATQRVASGQSAVTGWAHVGIPAEALAEAGDTTAYVKSKSRRKSRTSIWFRNLRDTLSGRRFRRR